MRNTGAGNSSSKPAEMAGDLRGIISWLEQQKSAIERALSALRET
jgi:hypothetical protein